jgi:HEAT repeat protein
MGAPANVEREVAKEVVRPVAEGVDPTPLKPEGAIAAIDGAGDRDEIFTALCRGARSRAQYVALFTVHAEMLVGRIALADTWIDRQQLSSVSMSLDAPTPLRTAVLSRSPLVGKVGDDPASRSFLERIGRQPPLLAALVPIVLRDRTVALLYADNAGRAFAKETMGELSNGTGAAARAFQRLILQAKSQDYRAAAPEAQAKVDGSRLHAARAGALSSIAGAAASESAWKTAAAPEAGRLHEEKTAKHAATASDTDALFSSVERGDDQARVSADQLVALGERGAQLAVARLPGPIRLDRNAFGGHTPSLADHGPLCSLVARFGAAVIPALERRVQDESAEVRYYVTLALGELAREAAMTHLSARVFDRDKHVRRVAVEAIARMPASEAKKSLIESLRGELPGPERDRQQKASEALGVLGDAASIPRLIELVKHDDTAVQSAARAALVAITKQDFGTSRWRWRGWWDRHKNEKREEWLFEGLAHGEDEVRASAADELKRMFQESFGYHWDAPKKDREEARKKWVEWYRNRR